MDLQIAMYLSMIAINLNGRTRMHLNVHRAVRPSVLSARASVKIVHNLFAGNVIQVSFGRAIGHPRQQKSRPPNEYVEDAN